MALHLRCDCAQLGEEPVEPGRLGLGPAGGGGPVGVFLALLHFLGPAVVWLAGPVEGGLVGAEGGVQLGGLALGGDQIGGEGVRVERGRVGGGGAHGEASGPLIYFPMRWSMAEEAHCTHIDLIQRIHA